MLLCYEHVESRSGVILQGYKKYGMDFFPKYEQKLEKYGHFQCPLKSFVPVLGNF